MNRIVRFLLIGSCLCSFTCSANEGEDPPEKKELEDPFAYYQPDPDVFVAPLNEDSLVTLHGKQAAGDQVLILFAEGATQTAMDEVIDAISGEVVGQVPSLRLYQVAIAAGDAAAIEISIATATAASSVEGAMPNYLAELARSDAKHCLDDDDLSKQSTGQQRCPLNEISYSQFVSIATEIGNQLTLNDVVIGMVDSGLHKATGQFDNTPIRNLNDEAAPLTDTIGHGTQVAGIMIADNGDGGTNGIASRVLGSHLKFVAGGFSIDMMELVAALRRAADAGARVVNFSIGWNYEPEEILSAVVANAVFRTLFREKSDTLFVVSAGNENTLITTTNYAPVANDAPNLLTVGGTKHCEPSARWVESNGVQGSNYGPAVDLAAPANKVPALAFDVRAGVNNPGGAPAFESGTSFAAPMVTSLAAVLFSIDPSLTPDEVITYIWADGGVTDRQIGSTRLELVRPMAQLVIDRKSTGQLKALLDDSGEELVVDTTAEIVNRICGGVTLTIEGLGTYKFSPEDATSAGSLNNDRWMISMQDDSGNATFSILANGVFDLNRDYVLNGSEGVASFADETDPQTRITGNSEGGSVKFTRCVITQRDVQSNTPISIEVNAVGGGSMAFVIGGNFVNKAFSTAITTPMISILADGLFPKIEEVCEGGTGPGTGGG